MKVLIFYRPNSEHSRLVEDFMHEFGRLYPGTGLDVLSVDTVDGAREAELYDVVSYPTVIARSDEGATLQRWDSGQMPLMNEVAYYANQ